MAKGINKQLAEEILSLEPTAKLEFYLIYLGEGNGFLPLHSSQNGISGRIIWQGREYFPYNIESSGWEVKNDQTLPRPKLVISNKNFAISTILKKYKNLNNARVIRKVTFARFLDDANFPGGTNPYGDANPNAGAPDQKFYISRVVSENKQNVEFELVSSLEMENQKLPNRKIHSFRCPFIYRGYGCRYSGPPVATLDDDIVGIRTTTNLNSDFILTAEDGFKDVSNYNRGSFATQQANITNGQGLYTQDGGQYPIISSADKIFGQNSIYFDQKSAIILCPNNTPGSFSQEFDLTNRAVSFWFKMDANEVRQYIDLIDFGDLNGGFGIYLEKKADGNYFLVAKLSGANKYFIFNPDNTINKDQWYHAAFTYTNMDNGNRYTENINNPYAFLYINGSLVRSSPISEPSARIDERNQSISGIGGGFNTTVRDINNDNSGAGFRIDQAFKGYMDEIRFFQNPLIPSSITNLYQRVDTPVLVSSNLTNKGRFVQDTAYSKGDYVYIGEKNKIYFVSLENENTSNPLNSSTWAKDACGKSIKSCALRFGSSSGLPFGGFPGTHKYPFSQKQNGY